jgi:hypothetical protein
MSAIPLKRALLSTAVLLLRDCGRYMKRGHVIHEKSQIAAGKVTYEPPFFACRAACLCTRVVKYSRRVVNYSRLVLNYSRLVVNYS